MTLNGNQHNNQQEKITEMFPIRPPDYVGIPQHSSLTSSSKNFLHRGSEQHHDRNLGVEVLTGQVVYHKEDIQHDDYGEEHGEAGIEIKKCDKLDHGDIESSSSRRLKTTRTKKKTRRGCSSSFAPLLKSKKISFSLPSTNSCSLSSSSFEDNAKSVNSRLAARGSKEEVVDPSVVLSLERTLFAALNNAWLLVLGGIGLMSVGHGDQRATHGGIAILVGGIVSAVMAYSMHIFRVVQLKKNITFSYNHSVFWASVITLMTVVCLLLELKFGVMYPYLQREITVTIAENNN